MTDSTPELKPFRLDCVACDAHYCELAIRYRCDCGGVLEVHTDLESLRGRVSRELFDGRRAGFSPLDRSGVWRFRELILDGAEPWAATRGEGNTGLYDSTLVAEFTGLDRIVLKHEGENPTGSFKDRGMTTGMTMAKALGMTRVACASTGNTSASMASYAAIAGLKPFVFIPAGNIAYGKLSQALAYGARTIQIDDDFDVAMDLVEQVCARLGIYLLNSVNPFRIEGQKAIGFELLQDLRWQVPDWVVLPGGNLGNSSALAKGMRELHALGLIDRMPRIAVIQARGASPFYEAFVGDGQLTPMKAETIATAIRIGNPVSFPKAMRGVRDTNGVVASVTDQEIMDAKAMVDRAGIGAEPASCATVAGTKKLVAAGVIGPHETVAGILTGHLLKDPDAVVGYHKSELKGLTSTYPNAPIQAKATLEAVLAAIGED